MSNPNEGFTYDEEQYRVQHAAEERFGSSTDIEEQTRSRLRTENATWRQQQASLSREKQVGCALLVMGGVLALFVLGAQLYGAWKLR